MQKHNICLWKFTLVASVFFQNKVSDGVLDWIRGTKVSRRETQQLLVSPGERDAHGLRLSQIMTLSHPVISHCLYILPVRV